MGVCLLLEERERRSVLKNKKTRYVPEDVS